MRPTHAISAGLAALALLLPSTALQVAAQSPQPSADVSLTDDVLPGVTLVTQEVEPGVLRVVNDGNRDLSMVLTPDPEPNRRPFRSNLLAGLDGSIWVFGPDEFYRVGQEQTYPVGEQAPNVPWQKAEAAPDGSLWTLVESETGTPTLQSFDAGSWTVEREAVDAFDMEPDGTVWVRSESRFIRLRDDWSTPAFGSEVVDFWVSPVMHGTEVPGDEVEVLVQTYEPCPGCGLTVWLLQEDGDTHGGPAGALPAEIDVVDMGDQGDHWIYQHLDVPLAGPGVTDSAAPARTMAYLVHVTGASFAVYTDEQGVPSLGFGGVFKAGPDGSVWLTPEGDGQGRVRCGGLANFDGTTWTRYLGSRCIYSLEIAPDGTVWVQAGVWEPAPFREELDPRPVETFVIRPEAAAATE